MSELLVVVFKFGFLALVWVFILICANVIRSDLFGHAVTATEPATPAIKERPKKRVRRNATPRVLAVTQGRQRGLELSLDSDIEIGRAPDCTLLLDDDYSSSHHAAVRRDPRGTGWYVEDHGSTNGTYVNDTRITTPTTIGLADEVRIGRTILKLVP